MRDLWKSFNAELDLMRDLQKSFAAKRKQESVADTSEDLFSKQLAIDLKSLPTYERCLAQQELQQVMFKYKLNTFKRREDHQNMDKQKFSCPTDFKELLQILNRFSFPYISSPYQCMISPKPQSPDNLKANQPQLESSIQSLSDSATNVIQQNVSIFRFS